MPNRRELVCSDVGMFKPPQASKRTVTMNTKPFELGLTKFSQEYEERLRSRC